MKDFSGRTAIVTGGGSGMGRELVRQLVAGGCHVAFCDLSAAAMAETRAVCEAAGLPQGVRLTHHVADVADEVAVLRFRDEAVAQHQVDHIHLLFNNAGIGGGGSMVADSRAAWERTFNICWGGVYYNIRAFMPLLLKATEGHIVNTSSVNGFWASIGPNTPHTAYSAAKFAVKGFTEALIADLRVNAPHIKCSVVMPGHIGTGIAANSRKIQLGTDSETMGPAEIAATRTRLVKLGMDEAALTDAAVQAHVSDRGRRFLEAAPMTAAQAATVILDGVKAGAWRILVGDDAHAIDARVRATPEAAYDPAFFDSFVREVGWIVGR